MSCTEDEAQKQTRILELKFPSIAGSNGRTSGNLENYTVTVKSTEPLVIISDDLIIVKVIDQVTGRLASVIVQKMKVDLKE